MPLSTLKLQFLFLQFSTQAMLMSSTCPLDNFLTKSNCKSLHKYKIGIYIKFHHMLRGKIFEINEEIKVGGQICPPRYE